MSKKFEDWFTENINIGKYPYLVNTDFKANEYDCIINVSDEFYPNLHEFQNVVCSNVFWFPMNERKRDIGLNSIYGALNVLYYAEQKNFRVYLHCHSGRNRSRMVAAAYYYMRTGKQWVDTFGDPTKYGNRLIRSSRRGYLPPQAELEQFIQKVGEFLKQPMQSVGMAGILDTIKKETINNF